MDDKTSDCEDVDSNGKPVDDVIIKTEPYAEYEHPFGSIAAVFDSLPSFRCSECLKSFSRADSLKRHEKIHTEDSAGERQHKCLQCPKSFKQSSDLQRHLRTHTGERPFQCMHCPKSFKQASATLGQTMLRNNTTN
jgi:uncharacterized Zn-finger protein